MHAFGVLRYAHGGMYEGEFKNGLKHGYGKLKHADGQIEGTWENGEPSNN